MPLDTSNWESKF